MCVKPAVKDPDRNPLNFAQGYCAREEIAPAKFAEVALRRSLFPAARLLRPLLAMNRNYFNPDREFVLGVGRITRFRDFDGEATDFRMDPNNRGFMRRVLKLRVSVQLLRHMVHDVFREGKH